MVTSPDDQREAYAAILDWVRGEMAAVEAIYPSNANWDEPDALVDAPTAVPAQVDAYASDTVAWEIQRFVGTAEQFFSNARRFLASRGSGRYDTDAFHELIVCRSIMRECLARIEDSIAIELM